MRGTSWPERVLRVLLTIAAALVATLIVTGVWLAMEYLPGRDQAARSLHRGASTLLVQVAFVILVMVVAMRARRRRWPITLAVLALVLVGSFTGYLLPWDQLALWSVSTGDRLSGIRWLLDDDVRFVLINNVEVGPSTYGRWAVFHVLVLPVIGAIVGGAWVLRERRARLTR